MIAAGLIAFVGLMTSSIYAATPVDVDAVSVEQSRSSVKPKKLGEAVQAELEEQVEAAEASDEARLDAVGKMHANKQARVVVLQWPGRPANYQTDALIRDVRKRIARPKATFYPEVDLYQAGRREPDKTVSPLAQRGIVPDEAIAVLEHEVSMVKDIQWGGMTPSDWGLKADYLRKVSDQIWFLDRPELRAPLFQLFVQLGRAVENANLESPPYYSYVDGSTVNYYWYLAASFAFRDSSLMALIDDPDLYGSVDYYKQQLTDGEINLLTLSFEGAGVFEPKRFAEEFQVFINGDNTRVDHPKGLVEMPPGRVDIYLKRKDGHSISDSISVDKLGEKIYGVRANARLRMGDQFIDQLMQHPNECSPDVDGDIIEYLSIYAKLHEGSEVYVAIPEGGDPYWNRLWRWQQRTGTLELVHKDTRKRRFRLFGFLKGKKDAIHKQSKKLPNPTW